jgi:hypothetical protein
VGIDEDMTPLDTTIDYKVSPFLHLHNDKTKNWLLPNIVTCLGTMVIMIENGYAMNKINLKVCKSIKVEPAMHETTSQKHVLWLLCMSMAENQWILLQLP